MGRTSPQPHNVVGVSLGMRTHVGEPAVAVLKRTEVELSIGSGLRDGCCHCHAASGYGEDEDAGLVSACCFVLPVDVALLEDPPDDDLSGRWLQEG